MAAADRPEPTRTPSCPASARPTNRTFVGAFQSIDEPIINPCSWRHSSARWCSPPWPRRSLSGRTGDRYCRGYSSRVNVSLNDGIKAAGDPDRIPDLTAVRQRFIETRWAARDMVRAVASTAAFGCLALAQVLHGHIDT
jgi:hypothetical protein